MFLIGYEQHGIYTIEPTMTYSRFDGDVHYVSEGVLEWVGCRDRGGHVANAFAEDILSRLHGTFVLEMKDIEGFCAAIQQQKNSIASVLADLIVEKSELRVERDRRARRLKPVVERKYKEYEGMFKHLK